MWQALIGAVAKNPRGFSSIIDSLGGTVTGAIHATIADPIAAAKEGKKWTQKAYYESESNKAKYKALVIGGVAGVVAVVVIFIVIVKS